MSKILKSTADAAWHKAPIPEGFNIDSLKNASAQKYGQHIEILVLIRAMDIACKFVHVPSRGFYPKFSKPLELDSRTKSVSEHNVSKLYANKLQVPQSLGQMAGQVGVHASKLTDVR